MKRDFTLYEQRILESLSTLSYRTGDLKSYLKEITLSVSQLLQINWSTVTLCQNGFEQVLASSLDFEGMDQLFSLHGSVTNTVVTTGQTLTVEDVRQNPEAGEVPGGYLCYLGVPLRTAQGETIGTICSFNRQPQQFTDSDIHTAELFAERAATAIDNYHLYQLQLQFNERLEAEVALRTAELEAAQTKLMEQERLAAIGEFAAMLVHEIRNPLTTITMGLNYAQKQLQIDLAQERLALSISEANRLNRLLSELLTYAKPQVAKLEELELSTWLQIVLISIDGLPEAQGRQINFTRTFEPIKVLGDRDKLKQVMINILRNACEASPLGEAVDCEIEALESTFVGIRVRNQGEVILPDVLSKLGRPFFSTKPQGTGLGLAIVNQIVKAHAGRLLIQSDDSGTRVTVQLPRIRT
ncbi:GAF domain-containing protein [Cyanobacteria bacterium FACHB-63]|nr:GAF domain-containing protein [Cyanobacteria bacterium FACHB-63]